MENNSFLKSLEIAQRKLEIVDPEIHIYDDQSLVDFVEGIVGCVDGLDKIPSVLHKSSMATIDQITSDLRNGLLENALLLIAACTEVMPPNPDLLGSEFLQLRQVESELNMPRRPLIITLGRDKHAMDFNSNFNGELDARFFARKHEPDILMEQVHLSLAHLLREC